MQSHDLTPGLVTARPMLSLCPFPSLAIVSKGDQSMTLSDSLSQYSERELSPGKVFVIIWYFICAYSFVCCKQVLRFIHYCFPSLKSLPGVLYIGAQ